MRRLIITLLAVGMTVPMTPVVAAPPQGPVYLALGDSYGFGAGTPREDKLGYVPVLHRSLKTVDCREGPQEVCPHLELVNMSVPGATSSSLIANQLQPALDLIVERNTDADPDNDVVLVTVTIGGNDLFNPVLAACSGGASPACAQTIATIFGTLSNNLTIILGMLRNAAPDTQIVISTYDNPLGACFLAPIAPLANVVLEGGSLNGGALPFGYNDIIRSVAGATQSEVADMFGKLTLDDWVGGEDCLHPDISGYRTLAEIFLDEISDLN